MTIAATVCSGTDEALVGESSRQEIEQLGKLHRQPEVRPEHYEFWLDSHCEAVAKLDPEYRAELGQLWREAMRPGIALILFVSEGAD